MDQALAAPADRETDLSVHSMKDVESQRPDTLAIVAMLERADGRDRLIGVGSIEGLKQGALVATSSPRRAAQLLALRPDLNIEPIRGNVQTRLDKIARGEADATMLAAAGLDRLGIEAGSPGGRDDAAGPGQRRSGSVPCRRRTRPAVAIDHAPHRAVGIGGRSPWRWGSCPRRPALPGHADGVGSRRNLAATG